jgi:ankyrin repeat protein
MGERRFMGKKEMDDKPLIGAPQIDFLDTPAGTGAMPRIKFDFAAANKIRLGQLSKAVERGSLEDVVDFLECGANVNDTDSNGNTALMVAAKGGHTDIARALIGRGADVNGGDKNNVNNQGNTALMMAAEHGWAEIAQLLIDSGADVNLTSDFYNTTALFNAAKEGHEPIVRMLIESGIDINKMDYQSNTALIGAIMRRQVGTVRLLIENGAMEADVYNLAEDAMKAAVNGMGPSRAGKWDEPCQEIIEMLEDAPGIRARALEEKDRLEKQKIIDDAHAAAVQRRQAHRAHRRNPVIAP